jgi:RNA polymerase sigma-70 factor (ECF subfamily)
LPARKPRGIILPVSGTPGKSTAEAPTLTLGDLLYADRTRRRVSEEDWQAVMMAVAAGSRPALHVLFQRTHRIVFTLIMRVTGNRQAAEELTLEVFHDVWRQAGTYQASRGTVVGWIMNHARARALGWAGAGGRRVAEHPDARRLQAALQRLGAEERQVIEEAFFNEHSYVDVAARLQLPLDAVKARIGTGLAKLQSALDSMEQDR